MTERREKFAHKKMFCLEWESYINSGGWNLDVFVGSHEDHDSHTHPPIIGLPSCFHNDLNISQQW